uniref:Uncharacterized protein n=1 Tax=Moniliophthora roreri TaxID=221103 RepID=A0A0W0FHY3_MONRR
MLKEHLIRIPLVPDTTLLVVICNALKLENFYSGSLSPL